MKPRTSGKRPTAVSVFTGAGGFDLGLEAAGFETLYATDIDYHSCQTLTANKEWARSKGKPFLSSAVIEQRDILELSGAEILKVIGIQKGGLDLLVGGPPCQAFSVFGKRRGSEDSRGQLVYHYLRLLRELQPKSFVLENVYGLLTVEGGAVYEDLLQRLQKPIRGLNYTLSVHRINAIDYGVPQHRDRVFIIGSREGRRVEEIKKICGPQSEIGLSLLPVRTVKDAFCGLPRIGSGVIANHTGRVHSKRIVDRYRAMKYGERDSHTRINKLDPDRPSFTIIVGSDKGGGKGHVHPHEAREVTPRESARIQCFPDWWEFSGTSRHPIRQVGNAVPSLLGFAVGNAIQCSIFLNDRVSLAEGLELLDQTHLFSDVELLELKIQRKAS